jgi:protease-4
MSDEQKSENWEKQLIERLAFASLQEQRRTRRWGIFFKSLFFLYLIAILVVYTPKEWGEGAITRQKHTALININGVISQDSEASADNVVTSLRKAFENKNTAAVILRINSPGGSPVQAGYINDEIYRLKDKYPEIPVYAVIVDICASGGYYIAAAADEIYADKASVVGSIGVVMAGFGFVDALEKLGIERRLITAGANKAMYDAFSPVKPDERDHLQRVLNEIHTQFINTVIKGRRDRLIADSDKLYSGLIWTGEQGLELGLVDGLGSSSYVAREVVGVEEIVDYTRKQAFLDRVAKRLGTAMADASAPSFRAY